MTRTIAHFRLTAMQPPPLAILCKPSYPPACAPSSTPPSIDTLDAPDLFVCSSFYSYRSRSSPPHRVRHIYMCAPLVSSFHSVHRCAFGSAIIAATPPHSMASKGRDHTAPRRRRRIVAIARRPSPELNRTDPNRPPSSRRNQHAPRRGWTRSNPNQRTRLSYPHHTRPSPTRPLASANLKMRRINTDLSLERAFLVTVVNSDIFTKFNRYSTANQA
jgi:hypothetical protein